jgi:hypothetical protein
MLLMTMTGFRVVISVRILYFTSAVAVETDPKIARGDGTGGKVCLDCYYFAKGDIH